MDFTKTTIGNNIGDFLRENLTEDRDKESIKVQKIVNSMQNERTRKENQKKTKITCVIIVITNFRLGPFFIVHYKSFNLRTDEIKHF